MYTEKPQKGPKGLDHDMKLKENGRENGMQQSHWYPFSIPAKQKTCVSVIHYPIFSLSFNAKIVHIFVNQISTILKKLKRLYQHDHKLPTRTTCEHWLSQPYIISVVSLFMAGSQSSGFVRHQISQQRASLIGWYIYKHRICVFFCGP